MSEEIANEISKKIQREMNIIQGATNVKQKTQNASVIQRCNTSIQESNQNIEYLKERLNQLRLEANTGTTSGGIDSLSASHSRRSPKLNEANYLRLDLMKYDCPSLRQRIQYMINQLDTKLKVEQKYYEANEKLSKIYEKDGDYRFSSVAEDGRIQGNHKIQLLRKSLKRYEDMNISLDHVSQDEEAQNNAKFRNKAQAGCLTIGISSIRDVDHIASPLFSRKTESYISIKVDDEEKVKTKGSRSDKWNEEFNINIEKGHEIEIAIIDKIAGSFVPVAIGWFLISDIAEEIRRKKVGQGGVGWVSASRIQNGSKTQNPNTVDNFTLNEKEEEEEDHHSKEPIKSSCWYVLEPAGQILLTFGFTKSTAQNKKTLRNGLNRHGAIRKRDEEVFEQQGHQFIQKSFYNIMRCALCAEFIRYSGYQCQDCKFLCHKKCYEKVITKCISKSSTDIDPDELKLNHRIPHRFEHYSNRSTNWCCHCGYLLPWTKKNVLKCSECDTMCHNSCSHLVPDFCGMSMEKANEILKAIKATESTAKRKKHIEGFERRQSSSPSKLTISDSLMSKPETLSPSVQSVYSPQVRVKSDFPLEMPTELRSPLIQITDTQKRLSTSQEDYLKDEYDIMQQQQQFYDFQRKQQEEQRQYEYEQKRLKEQQEQERRLYQQRQEQERQEQLQRQEQQQQQQQQQHQLQQHHLSHQYHQSPPYPEHELSFQNDIVEDNTSKRLSHYGDRLRKDPRFSLDLDHGSQGSLSTQQPDTYTPSYDSRQASTPTQSTAPVQKEKRHRSKIGLDDFNFITVLGRGNFGKVMLGRSHRTKRLCAVKILKKDMIIENGEIASLQSEKEVFLIANRENHPFMTNLHCCFQTANRIYFVMEYVSGGDLMWHVQQGTFSMRRAKFYASEILLALKYLHENGIVYRDLKLDNIMLNTEGHVKLADYGLCKKDMWYGKTTNTFCGTPEFMAPEILKEQNYTRSVDWWAFGVLVYQMLLGKSPFRGEDEDEVFNAILTDEPLFPIQMASEAVGLLESLLDKNPQTRLGSGPRDAEEIMEHPYFRNINFLDVLNLRVPPPYIPEVKSEEDTQFFDKDFTSEIPRLTPVNSVLDSSSQVQFRGFSYVNEESGV